MSSDNGSQVAAIYNTPQSRTELYKDLLALQKLGWKDDGKQVHKYLVDNIDRVPPKEDAGPTLVFVLLGLYGSAGKEKKEVVDGIISDIISRLPAALIDEKGGSNRETPLHSAVSARNRVLVLKLIQRSPDCTAQNSRGKNPLHLAARAGSLAIVKELVSGDSTGVSIFCQDDGAKTPIILACENRHANTAKYLLKASPRAALIPDRNGYNALHMSARQGLLSVLETQFERLEKPDEVPKEEKPSNEKGEIAEENGATANSSRQQSIAPEAGISVPDSSILECRTKNGQTLLHVACVRNHLKIVELLLRNNADPTALSKAGDSCLRLALSAGHFEISERLLQEAAVSGTLSQLDGSGNSILSIACSQMEAEAVEILSNAGADCALPNRDFSTPISKAIAINKPAHLSILLCSGSYQAKSLDAVRYKTRDGKSSTALHLACQLGHQRCLELLLQHDVSPNIKDGEGRTALHEASRLGSYGLVNALFDKSTPQNDVRVNELDDSEWSALHYASYQLSDNDKSSYRRPDIYEDRNSAFESRNGPYEEVLRHLLHRGADISLPNAAGDLALHLSARQGHANRVHQLIQCLPRVEDESTDILQKLNKDGATPLACALRKRHPDVAKLLAEAMSKIQFHDTKEMEDEIFWLAEKEQTRDIISEILLKGKHMQSRHRVSSSSRNPLVLAVIIGSAKLVWYLLLNSIPGPARDDSIKAAIGTAHDERDDYVSANEKEFATGTDGDSVAGTSTDASNISATKTKYNPGIHEQLKIYSDILDILHNPPATGRLGRGPLPASEPLYDEKSQPARFVNKYRVELVDCYNDSFLRRSATVKEALYDVGPNKIMKATSQRTQELQAEFLGLEKPQGAVRMKHPPNVLWIHLPANNVSQADDGY